MILDSLEINNFGPFFGHHVVKFRPGYNVIIGDNGHGKTRIGQAIMWTLSGARALTGISEADLVPIGTSQTPATVLTCRSGDDEIVFTRNAQTATVAINGTRVVHGKQQVSAYLETTLGCR